MGFQSKTYSLSDEVVAAIEAARAEGLTPNQLLRRVLVDLKETPLENWKAEDFRLVLLMMRKSDPRQYKNVIEIVQSLNISDSETRGSRPKGDKTR